MRKFITRKRYDCVGCNDYNPTWNVMLDMNTTFKHGILYKGERVSFWYPWYYAVCAKCNYANDLHGTALHTFTNRIIEECIYEYVLFVEHKSNRKSK